MPEPTYRPYLTASELTQILDNLKNWYPEKHLSLIRKLELFQAKINLGHTSPAYAPAPSMEEKLGFSESPSPKSISEIRLEAYRKFRANPRDCSSREIEYAQAYRYENDLMTAAEESEYESMRT